MRALSLPAPRFDFNEQTVIVTGGTRGIGRAISEAFVAAGARVLALYAGNTAAAESLAAEHGDALSVHQVDIGDYAAVEAFFSEFRQAHERLDVLVNNAGIRRDGVLAMLPADAWQRVIDVNLGGTFNMCKFATQVMMGRRYGRIVTITSPSGQLGFPGQANYAATKAGQVALTRSLSKEVASRGITANCVSPGFIDTELLSDLSDDQRKAYAKQVPVRRFGTPEEVAPAVLFLASEAAAYVTGAVLEVTGGL